MQKFTGASETPGKGRGKKLLSLCFFSSAAAVVLTAAALAAVAFFAFPYLGIVSTLLLLLIVELFAAGLIRRLSVKELSKIGAALFDRCDPDAYIRENERLLRRLARRSRYCVTVKSNLAVGYYSRGETEKGIGLCRELIREKEGAPGTSILPILHMNLCTMLLSLGRTEEAEESFQSAYELVVKFPENTPIGRQYRGQMNLLELRRRVMNGASGGCEGQLLQRFTRASSVYEKVNIQQLLSVFYRQAGEMGKYRSALRYVAENGNLLYVAREARKVLAEA